jgi:hypothetical protein
VTVFDGALLGLASDLLDLRMQSLGQCARCRSSLTKKYSQSIRLHHLKISNSTQLFPPVGAMDYKGMIGSRFPRVGFSDNKTLRKVPYAAHESRDKGVAKLQKSRSFS